MEQGGTYALVLTVESDVYLQIGKLGAYRFPPGYYVYVGSALGGLAARLRRHLRTEKRPRWHIDYLLERATLVEVWYALGQDRLECVWNGLVGALPGGACPIPGFGASDCRCRCHLTHFPSPPPLHLFEGRLKEIGTTAIRVSARPSLQTLT
ncbi:MAG TPA: GIY-YIG nuclease family protein [Dehalococcoidia bacterium]|jgi:Uri superfamily endonuclease|nr:GIY-YIG nuclease family protein [Dehalococcoidia bacterium]